MTSEMNSAPKPVIDIDAFLEAQEQKDQLRFLTCGSVDDGKSTLLGRLLYDSKTVFEDQLSAAETESKTFGTQGENVDLALLVDGLQAEREQGITIDVAYRFFETDKRKFIAADTPGHEQYTRNMATGASTAELAVILIDARKGILTQTRRHSYIVHSFGIRHVILAINKMDLVGYDQSVFDKIEADYREFATSLGIQNIQAIPLSALTGENVFNRQTSMPWYDGPPLIEVLETIDVSDDLSGALFRFPVQWVNRPNLDFRGFSGTIASGTICVGDEVMVFPARTRSKVSSLLGPAGPQESAIAGQSITLTLADEIDVSRGDILSLPDADIASASDQAGLHAVDQFAAHILWMDQTEMLPERSYFIRFASASASARIMDLTHRIDVNTLEELAAKTLGLNEIGYCKVGLDRTVAFSRFEDCRETGCFVLIDRFTNATVGAGVIDFPLRRASNIAWHQMKVDKALRGKALGQKPVLLWFTGLSGAGKSTIADRLEQKLQAVGRHTYLLDGDNVRHGLNKDLGFTDEDRVENIRRVGEVAKLMMDAGLIVLSSFISPFRSERDMARSLVEDGEFIEIYVNTSLEICEERDPKGLYQKARAGQIKNFTGIDSEYEPPLSPEIILDAGVKSVDALADEIIAYLNQRG